MKIRRIVCFALCLVLLSIGGIGIFPAPQAQIAYAVTTTAHTLRKGDRGSAVTQLQKQLKKLGYYTYPSTTTYYGDNTVAAVEKFQKAKKMSADGVAGKATLAALFGSTYARIFEGSDAYISGTASAAASASASGNTQGTLTPGMRSDTVRTLQTRLSELGYLSAKYVTGYYGPLTQQAVKEMQLGNGLSGDGIYGEASRKKLKGGMIQPYSKVKSIINAKLKGATTASSSTAKTGANVIAYAEKFLGVPYVWAAESPKGFDCSGFTEYVFKNFGVDLPHSARTQGLNYGTKIAKKDLREGDLVFFNTRPKESRLIGHVGIYIGGGKFIQASSSGKGKVMISSMSSGYYAQTFVWGRRVI